MIISLRCRSYDLDEQNRGTEFIAISGNSVVAMACCCFSSGRLVFTSKDNNLALNRSSNTTCVLPMTVRLNFIFLTSRFGSVTAVTGRVRAVEPVLPS